MGNKQRWLPRLCRQPTESVRRRCHSWHMSSFRAQPKGSNPASFSRRLAAHTRPVVNTIFPAMAAFKSENLVRDRKNAIVSNFLPFMVLYVHRKHLLVTGELRWGRGRLYTSRYTVTTRMTPALRRTAMRAISRFR